MREDVQFDTTEGGFSAFEALAVSVPVSLILSIALVVTYDLMFLWFFPIYAVSGAAMMLLTLMSAALLVLMMQGKQEPVGPDDCYPVRRVIRHD